MADWVDDETEFVKATFQMIETVTMKIAQVESLKQTVGEMHESYSMALDEQGKAMNHEWECECDSPEIAGSRLELRVTLPVNQQMMGYLAYDE